MTGIQYMHLLGCSVTDDLFEMWRRHLVSVYAPLYGTDDTRSLLPTDTILFTRDELGADMPDFPLEARDSYGIYRVDRAAPWVALLDTDCLRRLTSAVRTQLLREQWRLGRGQIYDQPVVREVCSGYPRAYAMVEEFAFETRDGVKIALQYDVWRTLPREVQWRWLQWFVAQDREECLSPSLGEDIWAAMDERYRHTVRRLAGTFAPASGPNCFSTTAAVIAPTAKAADDIAALWLHQQPFYRYLDALGFRQTDFLDDIDAVSPGSVLVWIDEAGTAQHACFVPAPGLALNKDAQGWFAPRQLLPLHHVLQTWQDDRLAVHLYQRCR